MVDRIGNVMKLLDTEEYPLCLNDFTSLLDEMDVEYDVFSVEPIEDGAVTVSRVTVYDRDDETVLISYFVTGGLIRTEIL